jgi:hypothetical protein
MGQQQVNIEKVKVEIVKTELKISFRYCIFGGLWLFCVIM